jgi:hypothetical protein
MHLEHLRDEQSQFAVAQYRDALALGNPDLVKNLARGGDGFDEHGLLVRDRPRNATQIP